LLREESAAIKWEASYVPSGKMLDDLKRFTQSRALVLPESKVAESVDHYPGPLLWWDDKEAGMILEGLGVLMYFGVSVQQMPGEIVMTSCSRVIDDVGLFVQYHQTTTVAPPAGCTKPLVLFAQNLSPLKDASWCTEVLPRVACGGSAADSVLQCWGLGYLLFCRIHPGAHLNGPPQIISAAQLSLVREVLLPSLAQLARVGPAFSKSVVLHAKLDDFVFPFDIYTNSFASVQRIPVFCQCVCERCNAVIPSLLFAKQNVFLCMSCSEMRSNGVVWPFDQVLSLLGFGLPCVVDDWTKKLKRVSQLTEIYGERFASELRSVLRTEAFFDAQLILQTIFPFNPSGEVVSQIALPINWRIVVGRVLRSGVGRFVDVFVEGSVPRLLRQERPLERSFLGHMLWCSFADKNDEVEGNCKLCFSEDVAELLVVRSIVPGERIVIIY
jgi:hypothetical protein